MLKSRKFILLLTLICFIAFLFINPLRANAYVYYAYGSAIPSYQINFGDSRYPLWVSRINSGFQDWNNAIDEVNITNSPSSDNKVFNHDYADNWYGLYQAYTYWFFGEIVYKFEISLNTRTINADATNLGNFIESVLVHEIGHSLRLDHTTGTAIMNSGRDRNVMYLPQTDDINGVIDFYNL